MKKVLLYSLSLMIGASAFAQQVPQAKLVPGADVAVKHDRTVLTGYETQPVNMMAKPKPQVQRKAVDEWVIGESFYDLQSNSAVQQRLVRNADGTMMAAWTFSDEVSPFNDRGTGYVHHDGTAWDPIPTSRIEAVRVGWPSMLVTGGGSEIVLAHQGSGSINMAKRSPYGSGNWTETAVPSTSGHWLLWNRAAVGGTNDNTIHMFALTAPTANGGTMYNGMDGALLYFRSQDEGATWDIQDSLLTGLDSAFFNSQRADAYTVIADGNNVAVVIYNQWADMVMMKSNDNGDTWTKTIINDFPIDLYNTDDGSDWNNDGTPDTITTCDEYGDAMFDANGMVHCWFGNMRVLDADTTDGNTSYFPGTDGLMYWNENMGTGNAVMIATAEDTNGDQILDWAGEWALYYCSLASMPSCGINADGTIFLTYAGYREDYLTATQNYRHLYMMKSNDNGTTWSTPRDVTPDENYDGLEHVFPCVGEWVDDKIRVLYMRDWEPGLAVRGDMDQNGVNEIIYMEVDTAIESLVSVNEMLETPLNMEVWPNPVNATLNVNLDVYSNDVIEIKLVDLLGQDVMLINNQALTPGEYMLTADLSSLAGGTYLITMTQGDQRMVEKLVVQHR